MRAFADALEVIPSTLAENAGLDPISIVTQLRNRHAQGDSAAGINVRKVRPPHPPCCFWPGCTQLGNPYSAAISGSRGDARCRHPSTYHGSSDQTDRILIHTCSAPEPVQEMHHRLGGSA